MDAGVAETSSGAGPREVFAESFAKLYAAAGEPPLARLVSEVSSSQRRRFHGSVPVRVTVPRISEWRNGRRVPARFDAFQLVLEVLIKHALGRSAAPPRPGMYEIQWWRQLWEQARAAGASATDTEVADTALAANSVCPYLGLAPYGIDDSDRFFGRDKHIAELVSVTKDALRPASGNAVVSLIAASGAGKSSLLRAGLIPAARRGSLRLDSGETWSAILVVPGKNPLRCLLDRIRDAFGVVGDRADDSDATGGRDATDDGDATGVGDEGDDEGRSETAGGGTIGGTATDPDTSAAEEIRAIIAAHRGDTDRLLIVVDQLEEIFTQCPDEDERAAFVTTLADLSAPSGDRKTPACAVVVGIRADFYSHCLGYPELADSVQRRAMVLRPMNLGELREVILSPARAAGLRVEPALVDVILHDFGVVSGSKSSLAAPASLPLLSHVLAATWRQRENGVRLTVRGYRSAGGVSGAVTVTGEQAWSRLDETGKVVAEELLLRLVRVGEDAADTRRRVALDELVGGCSDEQASRAALDVLADARLVTIDGEMVELTHEAVITSWDRLRKLIDTDRTGTIVRQRLEEAAKEWEDSGRDKQLLYSGHRLGQALESSDAAGSRHQVAGVAREFLTASYRQRRWLTRVKVGAVAALVLLMIIATTSATYAVRQARVSGQQRDNAIFTSLLAQADDVQANDPSLAAQLILVAHRLRPHDPKVYSHLLAAQNYPLATSLPGHTGAVYWVTHSPDGRVLATTSNDSTVRLWDTSDPTHYRPLQTLPPAQHGWVSSAAFSADGRYLASGNENGDIYLWDVSDPAHPRSMGGPIAAGCGSIFTVAFHPKQPILALACHDTTIRLWNIGDHPAQAAVITGPRSAVRTLAFSPDGRTLAAGGNDTAVRLWNVTDPLNPAALGSPLTGFTDISHALAFSPDSRLLAAGSDDHTVRLWDVSTPGAPVPVGAPLTDHTGPVWGLAFSPEGDRLAAGGWDGMISVWNVTDPAAPLAATDPIYDTSGVNSVSFDPVHGTLASGNQDGMVRIWSFPRARIAGPQRGTAVTAISPNGAHIALKSHEAGVVTWGNSTDQIGWLRSRYAIPGDVPIGVMAVDPRGSTLAEAASGSGNVVVWNLSQDASAPKPGAILPTRSKYYTALAFDNSGKHLAAGETDQSLTIWDLTNPTQPVALGHAVVDGTSWITTTVFDSDDKLLAAGTADGRVWLWDVRDPAHPRRLGDALVYGNPAVSALAFGNHGRALAIGGQDGSVQLFDLADPGHPQRTSTLTPTGAPSQIASVAFAPDGRTLAAASNNAGIQLWNITDPADPSPIGGSIVPVRSTQWNLQYATDGRSLRAVGQNGSVYSWDLDPDSIVATMCAATRSTLTRQWWGQYVSSLPFRSDVC
ncbi:hypothetical protein [Nocardia terpenica]|uniref:Novel STAND NTPase 1 domain-containing protein n=1 Tax=Nocardia terpenica TaxID=455432 RepID=A0A6G9Z9M0_9NOCA|nr:hypothetical protein [Nocardia terpenica]QIS22309.1 hypothetical protein F6W96_32175 [Nocardia terpenica]